jgi:hypothetical protein
MLRLERWFRQPTTVAGFSALSGTLLAVLLKQVGLAEALPLLVGSIVSMALPDNTSAKQEAADLTKQIVTVASQKKGTAA